MSNRIARKYKVGCLHLKAAARLDDIDSNTVDSSDKDSSTTNSKSNLKKKKRPRLPAPT